MDQQALDAAAAPATAADERREPPAPALIPGWRCVRQAIIRVRGEEGFVDLAALSPVRGVALIALLDADEEASPEEARTALLAMLEEEGFAAKFPGELPVVALAPRRAEAEQLAAAVERAFAGLPRPGVTGDWVEWLAGRLAPPGSAEPPRPRLVAPAREEPAPERSAEVLLVPAREEEAPPAPVEEAVVAPAEMPEPVTAAHGWLDWGTSFGFATGVVLALLLALALLSHAGHRF